MDFTLFIGLFKAAIVALVKIFSAESFDGNFIDNVQSAIKDVVDFGNDLAAE